VRSVSTWYPRARAFNETRNFFLLEYHRCTSRREKKAKKAKLAVESYEKCNRTTREREKEKTTTRSPRKKKRNRRARKQEKMRGTKNTRASRAFLRAENYATNPISRRTFRFRAFASSSEGRRSFFLFYFKNARLVFFLSLSLFLRGENGEKKYKRALVPSPPGANAKMFGEKRLAFRAEWTRVNAVWCSRREVFFRAMY